MLLIAGLLLWSAVHLSSAIAPNQRAGLIDRLGTLPYKGLYALLIVVALVMIVLGFRAMPVEFLYHPPAFTRHITMALMPIAVVLFISARAPSDIKRVIRHPQLTGVKTWALAHLLSNGDSRSVILFGGLLAWAVLEVIFIKRRDGTPAKPEPVGALRTTIVVIVGLGLTAALMFGHPWLAGVSLFSR